MIEKIRKIAFPRNLSLKLAMLYAVAIGLVLAILLFFAIEFGVTALFNLTYLSDESRENREDRYFERLEEYIDGNDITAENVSSGLFSWQMQNNYIYVTGYTTDDKLLYDPTYICHHDGTEPGDRCGRCNEKYVPKCNHIDENGDEICDKCDLNYKCTHSNDSEEDGICDICHGWYTECEHRDKNDDELCDSCGREHDDGNEDAFGGGFTWVEKLTVEEVRAELEKRKDAEGGDILTLTDGTQVHVLLGDYTEYIYYDIINVSALVVAMIAMVLVIMIYFSRITKRIIKLSNEVSVVADGDTDHVIQPDGEDEIGLLSDKVENMRTAMLERVAGEKAAMDANAELITAMSHDIRTPLTVLLGYLDIMKIYAKDEMMAEYVDASEKTALRLKKLSDDLFNYFLVFGSEAKVDIQRYDAVTLIEQLLAEHVLLLKEKGYKVENVVDMPLAEGDGVVSIDTDAQSLMRVIENVFSNIYKYADKSAPVLIYVGLLDNEFHLRFENGIDGALKNVESNKIGLKTCQKIAQLLGARFDTESADGRFTVKLVIPAIPPKKENDQ